MGIQLKGHTFVGCRDTNEKDYMVNWKGTNNLLWGTKMSQKIPGPTSSYDGVLPPLLPPFLFIFLKFAFCYMQQALSLGHLHCKLNSICLFFLEFLRTGQREGLFCVLETFWCLQTLPGALQMLRHCCMSGDRKDARSSEKTKTKQLGLLSLKFSPRSSLWPID